jgi:hypothetical protein
VLDGAGWRPTRTRPATTWSPAINGEIAHTWSRLGETSWIKTSNGWTKVRCSEYQFPAQQSNIVPRQLPAAPALPSPGGG